MNVLQAPQGPIEGLTASNYFDDWTGTYGTAADGTATDSSPTGFHGVKQLRASKITRVQVYGFWGAPDSSVPPQGQLQGLKLTYSPASGDPVVVSHGTTTASGKYLQSFDIASGSYLTTLQWASPSLGDALPIVNLSFLVITPGQTPADLVNTYKNFGNQNPGNSIQGSFSLGISESNKGSSFTERPLLALQGFTASRSVMTGAVRGNVPVLEPLTVPVAFGAVYGPKPSP